MQGLGFMLHQMISTTRVTRSGLSLRSPFLIRKVLHAQVFFCHRMCYSQDRALEPASGFYKSVWAIRMSTCWQINTPQSFLELIVLYQRQTQPSIVTPQRAERYNHLALWLPESMCNRCQQGLMGQGWAAWHLPHRQGACPALGEKCFSRKEKEKLNFRVPKE